MEFGFINTVVIMAVGYFLGHYIIPKIVAEVKKRFKK